MSDNAPLVSIITPSYNKGMFIEETILSVKNQSYPNIEHIVMDGGSTDNTIEVLRKYPHLKWVSEKDTGQSNAINKGWRVAQGRYLAYLNADDVYMPGAVETIVNFFKNNPDISLVYGDCLYTDEKGNTIKEYMAGKFDLARLLFCDDNIPQPTMFFRNDVLNKVGFIDEKLDLAMDLDFLIRVGLQCQVGYIRSILATSRMYPDAKSIAQSDKYIDDHLYILDKIYKDHDLPDDLKKNKVMAYSEAYYKSCIAYHSIRNMGICRKELFTAIKLYPRHCFNPHTYFYLGTSLLGSKIGGDVSDLIKKYKKRLSKN